VQNSDRIHEVLVIDDNPAEVRLLREAWQNCDVVKTHVSVLEDTSAALKYLRHDGEYRDAQTPDLVMLDYKMPVDGGIALTEIKGDPDTLRIPVLVLTGSHNPEDHVQIYSRHANACFLKPDNLDIYMNLICEIAKHWFTQVHPAPKPNLTPAG
jgi:chemotaxis family two-component system response regulator Rcp1